MSATDITNTDNPAVPPAGPLALIFTIGGNLIPLIGVLFWGWDVFSIFVLYWLENVVIGIFMILRILFSNTDSIGSFISGLFIATFFTFHYGLFTVGHGVFVFSLFGPDGFEASGLIPDFAGALDDAQIKGFIWAFAGLALAEAARTVQQLRMTPGKNQAIGFIFSPYGRIIVLHITLIFGGMLSLSLGQPLWALILLIGLKMVFELGTLTLTTKGLRVRDVVRKGLKR